MSAELDGPATGVGETPVDADAIEQEILHWSAGMATFVLTDVEDSTRVPEAVGAAATRHDELLDEAVSLHGGVRWLAEDENKGVVAAFTRAADAVAAALDVQRGFQSEGVPLKLRVALHTAAVQRRDEGQPFGGAVSRCARLRAVAHGGQVVLSEATRDLVLGRLPEHAELADLGVHRLGDLGRPEHVFGLVHPDLPAGFAPLRSLDTMPNNLPGELTSFVGRRAELVQIGDPLQRARLLTLTGAGGCGKTRLALQAAADAMNRHPDGVWWVELARLEDATLVPAAVIGALGLREGPGRALLDTLIDYLRARCALIVLDNCEHLLAACAQFVDAVLRACASLTVLATSRAPLGVPGEIIWRVPSMSLPIELHREPIEVLRQSDAVALFIDRAMQVRPNFAITAGNAPVVAQICHDLDGIPLAIELAAARVRMLAPEQIARGLSDRFRLLTGGARTVLPRHQTLQASIDWSHGLLSDGERVVLRRLSVFAGGWTLDAAEAVCPGEGIDRYDVLDLVTGLVDKSLVTTDEQGLQTRYRLLETVRQYATVRLAAAGELDAVRDRHLAYHLALAQVAEPQILGAGRDDPVLHILANELPNLRAALERAATTDPDTGLRLVNTLALFWLFTGRYQEGDTAYARSLDAASEEPTPMRGRVLAGRGNLGFYGGAYEAAYGWAQAALETGEACGDPWTLGRALNTLGFMVSFGDPASGRPLLERSLQLAIQAGDDWCRINAAQILGFVWSFQDEFDTARPILDDAYATATRLGYRWGFAWHWYCLAWEAIYRGRLNEARELLARCVAASDEVGNPATSGFAHLLMAHALLLCGEAEVAYSLVGTTLERVLETGAGLALGHAHEILARTEIALGEHPAARGHLETAVEAGRLSAAAHQLTSHLAVLGTLERIDGNLVAAHGHAEEALAVARRLGSGYMQASAERLLGRLALTAGDVTGAERYVHDALGRLVAKGFALDIPECLDILAAAAATLESFEEAARLLGAATAGRQRLGIVRFPPEPDFWTSVAHTTRMALGGDGYDTAFAVGAALGTDEAVGYVRRARGERKRPSRGWDSLTPTELDVVRHIAAGRTNRQIGEHMFISPGTVKVHLSHIFAKLGIPSRSHLAADATRRGLGPAAAPAPSRHHRGIDQALRQS
ncbi:MAG TPA: LuxR C-terminal-related transcriptional regulator [Pseudonocardiaceae bacterium]|nr:LuxR C-terminal-related transcriptional regulator [Pseudonocardiaceae bacterium]